jgi:hypothetical protein
MKIRIKDNFIRFRLTRSEVETLASIGRLEAFTQFNPIQRFSYAIESSNEIHDMQAELTQNSITLKVPARDIVNWPQNTLTGFNTIADNGTNEGLRLLLEKDFVCLDETIEDQSDNYPNPLAEQNR